MIIIHRCQCAHPDYFHNHQGRCTQCGCPAVRLDPEPELIASFHADGTLNEAVLPPGSKFGPGNMPAKLCSCEHCVALHVELAGAVA